MFRTNFSGFMQKKFSLLLLLTFLISLQAYAQSGITIKVKDSPLKSVIEKITKQSDYRFVYTSELKIGQYKVTVNSNNEPINVLLSKIFNPINIKYKIKEKQIVLGVSDLQQNKRSKIVGKVIDDAGEPLPGVYIITPSGENTTSNSNGLFEVMAYENENITFQYLGMVDAVVNADSKRNMSIVMKSDVVALDDIVVTGYQTLSRERSTGSFNTVKAEQIKKPTSNIAQRIIGTTAGLQSTTDEDGNVSFEIRGQTSLTANAQPLIVVDGFAIQDGFKSINPNDVESISILKDAAAASIWGARSANGVIVITTKSGKNLKKGNVKVEVQSFWKYSPKIDWSYANPLATSAETIDYEQKGYSDFGFFGSAYWLPNMDNYQDYSSHSLAVTAINENRLGYLSDSELKTRLNQLASQNNAKQIKKYMLNNPFTQHYNVSIAGASERMTNVLSLLYEQQDMNLKGNNQDKYNVSYRTNVNLFKWLDFNFNGNISLVDIRNNAIELSSLKNLSPYYMLVNEDGSYNKELWGNYGGLYVPNIKRHVPIDNFPYSDWSYNPIEERNGRDCSSIKTSVRAQGGLTFKIIKGFTFDTKIQYERIENKSKNIYNESTAYVRSTINMASTWDKTTNDVTSNLPKGGIMNRGENLITSYNWRNQANFDRGFDNDKHRISVIVGSEVSNIVTQGTSYPTTYGYNDNTLSVGTFPNGVGGSSIYKLTNWMGSSQSFGYTSSYSYNTERYFSLYANASYTFDKKYTLSASARTDASNLITDDPTYRYSPFWSVGASWNMTNEKFMQDIDWLDRLIVRSTFGYNGNVDRSTSFLPLINVYTTQNKYIQDFTATISSYGNPTLRWEKTGSFDLGFDYSILKSKIYGKLDFYNKKGKDLIVSTSIPSVNGTTSQKLNAAEMTNRGIEFEIGSTINIKDRDIMWMGSLNFSYNYNIIDKLYKSTYPAYDLYGGGTWAYVQDYNANTLWSFEYKGVSNIGTESDPIMRPVVKGPDGALCPFTAWTTGDARDYMLNMGTKVAPYSLGFNSNFKIYDFNFSFILTGKFGHVFNGYSFNYPSMAGGSALPNKLYSEVVNADPDKMAPIPFDGEERYYFWDRFYPYLNYLVQNANHIRCQEIAISYNVPKKFLNHLKIANATLYAQTNNLFVIANNKYNEDPEYPLGHIKPAPSFTFGINFTF